MNIVSIVSRAIATSCLFWILCIPGHSAAQEMTPFEGVIVSIEGQRLEVALPSGNVIWITTNKEISQINVGQLVSRSYMSKGDTLFVKEPVFR